MDKIGMLDSAVIRALLLAVAGLVGLILSFFGVTQEMFDAQSSRVIDAVLLVITTGSAFYAMWSRARHATPPITDAAVKATEQRVAQETADKQGGRASVSLLSLIAGIGVMSVVLMASGCASLNPVRAAQSSEQKAYALYGEFVVFEEQAAVLYQSSTASAKVKTALRAADAVAKPLADKLLDAAQSVLAIKLELDAGTTTKDKLLIALQNLDRYITEAGPKIKALGSAFKEAT
jgi:hypothetical protein